MSSILKFPNDILYFQFIFYRNEKFNGEGEVGVQMRTNFNEENGTEREWESKITHFVMTIIEI